MILVGDVGGTHTRLAFFEKGKLFGEKSFSSQKEQSLEEIALQFVKQSGRNVQKACFGIAGPVIEQTCKATNLPWTVKKESLQKTLEIPIVHLLNDLEAHAYSLSLLSPSDFLCLQKGKVRKGNQALMAAGTGLGEVGLFWDGRRHHPFACEGGHADFSPRTPLEMDLFLFLQKKFSHVSWERVVSGPGLYELYQFLVERKEISACSFPDKEDPSVWISHLGSAEKDPGCVRVVDWFVSLYGAEAGQLALKMMALGGVFIGGGIALELLSRMEKGGFVQAFVAKGRFASLLQTIPIWVILQEQTALLGAGVFAENFLHES